MYNDPVMRKPYIKETIMIKELFTSPFCRGLKNVGVKSVEKYPLMANLARINACQLEEYLRVTLNISLRREATQAELEAIESVSDSRIVWLGDIEKRLYFIIELAEELAPLRHLVEGILDEMVRTKGTLASGYYTTSVDIFIAAIGFAFYNEGITLDIEGYSYTKETHRAMVMGMGVAYLNSTYNTDQKYGHGIIRTLTRYQG